MLTFTPSQKAFLAPVQQINTDFGSHNWSVELSRDINHFLDAVGNDVVLFGGNIFSLTWDLTTLKIEIPQTNLIQDLTVIELDPTLINLNIANLVDYPISGSLLIYSDFKFVPDVDPKRPDIQKSFTNDYKDTDEYEDQSGFSPFTYKISLYNGSTILNWDENRNCIVFAQIDYVKDLATNQITSASISNNIEYIINGKLYYKLGNSMLIDIVDGGII